MNIETRTTIDIFEEDVIALVKEHVTNLGYQINELSQDGLKFHILAEPVTSKRKNYTGKEAALPTPAAPFKHPVTGKTVLPEPTTPQQ